MILYGRLSWPLQNQTPRSNHRLVSTKSRLYFMSSRVLGFWNLKDTASIPEIVALRIFKGLLILRSTSKDVF